MQLIEYAVISIMPKWPAEILATIEMSAARASRAHVFCQLGPSERTAAASHLVQSCMAVCPEWVEECCAVNQHKKSRL